MKSIRSIFERIHSFEKRLLVRFDRCFCCYSFENVDNKWLDFYENENIFVILIQKMYLRTSVCDWTLREAFSFVFPIEVIGWRSMSIIWISSSSTWIFSISLETNCSVISSNTSKLPHWKNIDQWNWLFSRTFFYFYLINGGRCCCCCHLRLGCLIISSIAFKRW